MEPLNAWESQVSEGDTVDAKDPANQSDKFKYHYEQGRIYMGMENRPLFYRVLSISGGAGFLLSTVAEFFFSKRFL